MLRTLLPGALDTSTFRVVEAVVSEGAVAGPGLLLVDQAPRQPRRQDIEAHRFLESAPLERTVAIVDRTARRRAGRAGHHDGALLLRRVVALRARPGSGQRVRQGRLLRGLLAARNAAVCERERRHPAARHGSGRPRGRDPAGSLRGRGRRPGVGLRVEQLPAGRRAGPGTRPWYA